MWFIVFGQKKEGVTPLAMRSFYWGSTLTYIQKKNIVKLICQQRQTNS